MAAPSKSSSMLSVLQRAAFKKWKESKDCTKLSSQFKQRSQLTSDMFGEDDAQSHVDVTFSIREDGNVDVLLAVSGIQERPSSRESQDVLDMPTSLNQPEDLLNMFDEGENEGPMKSDVDLGRPHKLYLYFLELQRLKAIKNIESNMTSKCGSPKIPYEGGLSELQRAAFEKRSDDDEMNEITPTKLASLNLKDDDSMQPTMGTLKEDPNSVLEIEPLLNKIGL